MHTNRFKSLCHLTRLQHFLGKKLQIVIYARAVKHHFSSVHDHVGLCKISFARPTAEHSRDRVGLSFSLFINCYF